MPTEGEILAKILIGYLPQSIREYIMDYASGSRIAQARMTKVIATKFAKELMESKSQALLEGRGGNDIMTSLSKPASPKAVLYLLTFPLKSKPTHPRTRREGWMKRSFCRRPGMLIIS